MKKCNNEKYTNQGLGVAFKTVGKKIGNNKNYVMIRLHL